MSHEIRFEALSSPLERGKLRRLPFVLVLADALKVRGIHARFQGAEETKADYTTTTTDGEGRTQVQHHTAVQYENFVLQEWLLAGHEKLGFFGNVWDGMATLLGAGQHEVMAAGEYPFEVEVEIPEQAPGTHKGQKSRVFYELKVQVDVPLARDVKAVQSFTVSPLPQSRPPSSTLRICYPDDVERGFFDKTFGPDVRIDLALAADQYTRGDELEGMFRVETVNPLNCRSIRANLVGFERTEAHGHTDTYVHQSEPIVIAEPGRIMGQFQREFSFTVPPLKPVSLRGTRFAIDWYLQLTLDVPWAKDPSLRAPIALLRPSE